MTRMNLPRRSVLAATALVAALTFPSALRADLFTPALDLPVNFPRINVDGSSLSRVQYDPTTKLLKLDASAIQITYVEGGSPSYILNDAGAPFGTFAIRALVDNVVNSHGTLGKLVSGIAPVLDGTNDACGGGNGHDFCVTGQTTGPDGITPVSGVLLRGEVVDFGAKDSVLVSFGGAPPIPVDDFEFHIKLTGGMLMSNYPSGHLVALAWGLELAGNPQFSGTFATPFVNAVDGVSGATDMFVAPLPPPVVYTGTVQAPINANGSSVFSAKKGVVPVKFKLTKDGVSTCELPPATISLERTSGGTLGSVTEDAFIHPSDVGSDFRVDIKACQYIYNLGVSTLGPATYVVRININALAVGNVTFALK
jgi:hypothetical protein